MRFEFATATRILFGPGTLSAAVPELSGYGRHPMIVLGQNPHRCDTVCERLAAHSLHLTRCLISGEPTTDDIEDGVDLARREGCDMVLAIGGGSVVDAGKAIAAMIPNTGPLTDYLEVIGGARPLANAPVPFVAVPTTAGTGAEVTRNAVIGAPAHRLKVSLRSPLMLPRLAIVDPELTLSLPPDVTAATGMDALTQLIEAFVSLRSNPMTDGLCREALPRCARSIAAAVADGSNLRVRTDMALASLFSGMALANGGLGAVHGIAAPLGGWAPVPHGVACARLLPLVFEANRRRLAGRNRSEPVAGRFDEIGRMLTGSSSAAADDGVRWLRNLCRELGIPPLSRYGGLSRADLPGIAERALNASSMKGNPVPLTEADIVAILERAVEGSD